MVETASLFHTLPVQVVHLARDTRRTRMLSSVFKKSRSKTHAPSVKWLFVHDFAASSYDTDKGIARCLMVSL